MSNLWGNISGSQAIELGMNIFNMAQQQAQQKAQLEQQIEQQKQENIFKKMQIDAYKQSIDLKAQNLAFQEKMFGRQMEQEQEKMKAEKEEWQTKLGAEKGMFGETMAFKEKELAQKMDIAKLEKQPIDYSKYPSALENATKIYEETGNWGAVQAVQKQFDMPVKEKPEKLDEIKDAVNVWKTMDQQGIKLQVDRKLGRGGVEMALPYEVIEKYGGESLTGLKVLKGLLGRDKYSKYSIPEIYDLYFQAKRFRMSGRTIKEISTKLKEAGYSEDFVGDLIATL